MYPKEFPLFSHIPNIPGCRFECQVAVAKKGRIVHFFSVFNWRPMSDLSRQLDALYAKVPATRCAGSGDCCALTNEEFDNYYATMFPLYRVEYANIVAYVERYLSPERRRELLKFAEERPRRCPFLGADHGCTIYPVRPRICRTFGGMNAVSIAREAVRNQGVSSNGAIEDDPKKLIKEMVRIVRNGRYDVAWTKWGIQVWCPEHNVDVIHIDFEGHTHATDISRQKTTEEWR